MPYRPRLLPLVLGAALSLLSACSTTDAPGGGSRTEAGLGKSDPFVLLDMPSQTLVACTGMRERVLGDGRLEVLANIKNRDSRRSSYQVQIVFRNELGIPTEPTAAWRTIILEGGATETLRFVTANPEGRRYTLRVRQAR